MKPRTFLLLFALVAPAFAGSEPELPPVIRAADLAVLGEQGTQSPPRAPVPSIPPPDPAAAPAAAAPLAPNQDGVIDLVAAAAQPDADSQPNPFRVRHRPKPAVREVPLAVQAALRASGARGASAVINGETCCAGDRVDDLVVEAIGAGSVTLRRGPILIEVPVQEQPVLVRMPR